MDGTERIRRLHHRGWHVCLILATALLLTPAGATVGDIGYVDQSFSGASTAPSGSKPESKLWWNDGFWWGSLYDTLSGDFHIFKLDIGSQTWADTGVALDDRSSSRADALWDGTHLYVASHAFTTSPASGHPSRLYRFSYDPATDTYSRDSGFPVAINDFSTETLVIAEDSTGTLWATWTQGNQVYVNRTVGDDLLWGTPFVLPVSGVNVNPDDISSLVSFGGNQIGVMWSNQNDSAVYFAVHQDGQPDTTWEASRTAIQGPASADDHINLKSLQSDGSGRVFAAIKTSMTTSSAPLIMLLVRDLATGNWTSSVFGRVSDDHTRPIVLLDEEHSIIHMFATAPVAGGTIYEKTSPVNTISFPLGLGTPVLRDAASAAMNNVTSTKQNVNSTTGLVVLATNDTTQRYWHAYQSLVPPPEVCDGIDNDGDGLVDEDFDVGAPCTGGVGACQVSSTKICSADHSTTVCDDPPVAALTLKKVSNTAVTANASGSTDKDLTPIATYTFDFGDGRVVGPQAASSASHTYAVKGNYQVTVTVADTAGLACSTSVVFDPDDRAPTVILLVTPISGYVPLSVTADGSGSTDTDGTPIASYTFKFGDGVVVGPQAAPTATHTYLTAGSFHLTLTVKDTNGYAKSVTKSVTVSPDKVPTAILTVTPTSGKKPLFVTADGSASTDSDPTPIATYTFNFGDGTVVGPQSTSTATHTFVTAGKFHVTLTVTDTAGLSKSVTKDVSVSN